MKIFLFILMLFSQPLWAQFAPTPGTSVTVAQEHVWDVGLQLNAAIYKLNVMKLDWQRDKLSANLLTAQTKGDSVAVTQIQGKIAEIDHRRDIEKKKLDLNNQLIAAKQQGDQGKADSILFQLKNLQ
jgi:hypothetical protein